MVREARRERVENGLRPSGEGWFVVNARELPWFETDGCGFYAVFEPEDVRFDQVGVGIGILGPGEPNAMYHGEDAQEDFLVLSGECLLLVEGEERRLRACLSIARRGLSTSSSAPARARASCSQSEHAERGAVS